jgi:hypothetical protein
MRKDVLEPTASCVAERWRRAGSWGRIAQRCQLYSPRIFRTLRFWTRVQLGSYLKSHKSARWFLLLRDLKRQAWCEREIRRRRVELACDGLIFNFLSLQLSVICRIWLLIPRSCITGFRNDYILDLKRRLWCRSSLCCEGCSAMWSITPSSPSSSRLIRGYFLRFVLERMDFRDGFFARMLPAPGILPNH